METKMFNKTEITMFILIAILGILMAWYGRLEALPL